MPAAPETIILRDDQQALEDGVFAGWNSGKRHVLGVAVTGFGKSVVMSDIAAKADAMRAKQCIIAHRKELVSQMSVHIARRGIFHRIIGPPEVVREITVEHREKFGRSYLNPSSECAVAGIDTLTSRFDELEQWGKSVQFAQTDEGHHVLKGNKWGKALELFPNAFCAGWTASPSRADGMGLGSHADGLYEGMVVSTPMRELINRGDLCEYDIAIPLSDFHIDPNAVGKDGDFTQPAMKEASERSKIVGDVVLEYCKLAFGKRGITFATDTETAAKIAAQFNLYGIPAAAVSAKTPGLVRNEYIRRFRRGELWQLVNVDLFGEGFDLPAVEVVSMARPTNSLAVYLQQFGRALRTMAGKLVGLIIDHVSNWKRHGLPDKPHFWTLDRREKRAKTTPDPLMIELTRCKKCTRPYEKILLKCPHCGTVPEPPSGGGRSCEEVDGDLALLGKDALDVMRKACELMSPAGKGAQASFAAGGLAGAGMVNRQIERIASQQRLKEAVAWFIGKHRALGHDDRETEKRFYLTLGMSTLEAYALPRADMDKISEIVEGWNK